MQRLSDANYPLTRHLVPELKRPKVLLAASGVVLLFIVTGMWILLTPALMVLLLVTIIHKAPNHVFTNFCEDAWQVDNGILLQLQDEQILVPFDQMKEITWHGSNNPPRAKIHLRTPSKHGALYTYVPDLRNGGRKQAKATIENLNGLIAG